MGAGERAAVVPAQRRQHAMRAQSTDQREDKANPSSQADAPSTGHAANICLNQ